MFYSVEELIQQAENRYDGNVAELMIATEIELSGRSRSEIIQLMTKNLEVMKASVQKGLSKETSRSGLTGGDAKKLDDYIKKEKPYLILPFSPLLAMLSLSMNTMPRWAWSVQHQQQAPLAVSLPFSPQLLIN